MGRAGGDVFCAAAFFVAWYHAFATVRGSCDDLADEWNAVCSSGYATAPSVAAILCSGAGGGYAGRRSLWGSSVSRARRVGGELCRGAAIEFRADVLVRKPIQLVEAQAAAGLSGGGG